MGQVYFSHFTLSLIIEADNTQLLKIWIMIGICSSENEKPTVLPEHTLIIPLRIF